MDRTGVLVGKDREGETTGADGRKKLFGAVGGEDEKGVVGGSSKVLRKAFAASAGGRHIRSASRIKATLRGAR